MTQPPTITAARRAEHRLYLRVSGTDLTVIYVQENCGQYYTATLSGKTEKDCQLSALLTALQSVPFRSIVYIHTSTRQIRELLASDPPSWPRELKNVVRQKSLELRNGTVGRLDMFWQDMLNQIAQGNMPTITGMNQFALHTYTLTDGLQTYISAVLYGEGQLNLYNNRRKGEHLSTSELGAVQWAFDLLPHGKTVELHHQHPQTQQFWDATDDYLQQFPDKDTKRLIEGIGKHVASKNIRFNTPPVRVNDPLSRAVRSLAGRSLNA